MTAPRTASNIPLAAGIVLLTLATAVVHLQLNFPDPMFILNGLGYLGLLGALYLPVPRLAEHKDIVRLVLIGYTSLTLFLWVAIGERTPIGYLDKAIEVSLIVLLLIEARRSR
ncbi:MAG: hypothetical protein ACR2HO_11275 [Rubrobacteraceae bacterium]|jgi:hypothetical protein|nr:hypothetical protein [Rubrobacter sp.]